MLPALTILVSTITMQTRSNKEQKGADQIVDVAISSSVYCNRTEIAYERKKQSNESGGTHVWRDDNTGEKGENEIGDDKTLKAVTYPHHDQLKQ